MSSASWPLRSWPGEARLDASGHGLGARGDLRLVGAENDQQWKGSDNHRNSYVVDHITVPLLLTPLAMGLLLTGQVDPAFQVIVGGGGESGLHWPGEQRPLERRGEVGREEGEGDERHGRAIDDRPARVKSPGAGGDFGVPNGPMKPKYTIISLSLPPCD